MAALFWALFSRIQSVACKVLFFQVLTAFQVFKGYWHGFNFQKKICILISRPTFYFFRRFALVAAVLVLTPYGRSFLTQAMFKINFEQGKEGYGLAHSDVFLNLTETPRVECFYRCSTECHCSAFQMFKETDCQLLSSSRFLKPLQLMLGYTYYDLIPWEVI